MKFKLQRVYTALTTALVISTLSACGGGSSSSSRNSTPVLQGTFLDAAVEGLSYASGAVSGVTDVAGIFEYEAGGSVTFTLEGIVLGSAQGAATLTPLDIIPGAANENDPRVINILRFLQTLDNDEDLDNGIQITQVMRNLIADSTVINFNQSVDEFTNDIAVQTLVNTLTSASVAGARDLISESMALLHFQSTLEDIAENTNTGETGTSQNGPEGSSFGRTTGTVALSGTDTETTGTQLSTGFVGAVLASSTMPNHIIIVDQASTVEFSESNGLQPNITNLGDFFILVVLDDPVSGTHGISMTIVANGIENDYLCSSPFTSPQIDCGLNSVSLDIENNTVTFNNTTVLNQVTATTLTLNGTLVWIDGQGNSNTGGGEQGSGGAATALQGTWETPCLFNQEDDVYEIITLNFEGNNFDSNGSEYSDLNCEVHESDFDLSGTFEIGSSLTTPSGVAVNAIDYSVFNGSISVFDIFRIEANLLLFGDTDGDENDGVTAERRAIELDTGTPFIRQGNAG